MYQNLALQPWMQSRLQSNELQVIMENTMTILLIQPDYSP
jgi:hypothetical protein